MHVIYIPNYQKFYVHRFHERLEVGVENKAKTKKK